MVQYSLFGTKPVPPTQHQQARAAKTARQLQPLWAWDQTITPLSILVGELNERLGTPESWLLQPLLAITNAWYDLYDEVTIPYAQALTHLPSVRGLSESAARPFRKTIQERRQMAVGILTALFTERQQYVVDKLLARFNLTEADEEWICLIEWFSEYFTHFSPEEGDMTMQDIIDTIVEEASVFANRHDTVPTHK